MTEIDKHAGEAFLKMSQLNGIDHVHPDGVRLILEDAVRRAKAEAWEEGYYAGFNDAKVDEGFECSNQPCTHVPRFAPHDTVNPYR